MPELKCVFYFDVFPKAILEMMECMNKVIEVEIRQKEIVLTKIFVTILRVWVTP